MATLEVKALTKWYGSARGIEDVTFSLAPGEVFGYLGPNGSGKTTTIRCIMGLLRPTSGQAWVFDTRVVAGQAVSHEGIGYLPGDFRIWPWITARRALVLFLYMLFAVAVPTGLLAGQVQYGTMELILSRPVSKTQVYLCAGMVTLLGMVGLASVLLVSAVAGGIIWHRRDLPL